MPTRKITRAARRTRGGQQHMPLITEYASLVDFLNTVWEQKVSLLPVSSQRGQEILGRGLSGGIEQATQNATTVLAFKEGIPSKRIHDTADDQDWYSLVTEIAILQHGSIRSNPHFIDLIGVSFYVEATNNSERRAWPLLVTPKINAGNLASVLENLPELLTDATRFRLCSEILEAVHVLHSCAHGDIKPENILIQSSESGEVNCLLIDFGSSTIRGQTRLLTASEPWSAPELQDAVGYTGFEKLAQIDLFSCALTLVHLLVPLQDLADAEICLIRRGEQTDEDWARFLREIRNLKLIDGEQTPRTFVALILEVVDRTAMTNDARNLLQKLVCSLIAPKPGDRRLPWPEVVPFIEPFFSDSFKHGKIQILKPPPLANSSLALEHDEHITFKLVEALGELDDTDYILRQDITRDLTYKAKNSSCVACRRDHSFQLAICYLVAFGCHRSLEASEFWLSESGKQQEELDSAINQISLSYKVPGTVDKSVLSALGIGFMVSSEKTEDYQMTGRSFEAETSLMHEIEARCAVFGESHRCLIKPLSQLAMIYTAQSRLTEAEMYQRKAVNISESYFGERHPTPLLAKVLLSNILSEQGRLDQAVNLQMSVQPGINEVFGKEHPETITSLQVLANIFAGLGQLEEAEAIYENVIKVRERTLAPSHPLTIRAQFNHAIVLRSQGLLSRAYDVMSEISGKLQGSLAGDDLTRAQLGLVSAMLYRDLEIFDDATKSVKDALAAMDKLRLPKDDLHRLSANHVLATNYGACGKWEDEEVLLRKILEEQLLRGGSNEKNRGLSITRIALAENLVKRGKLEEATAFANQVIVSSRSLNEDPENLVACNKILAKVKVQEGRPEEGAKIVQDLADACKSTLGNAHALTLEALGYCGLFFAEQGMHDKAQAKYEEVITHFRDTHQLGKDAIIIFKRCAIAHQEQANFTQAEAQCHEGIKWATTAVGDRHTETLALYTVLADTYSLMGRLSEAEELYVKLETQCEGMDIEPLVKEKIAYLRIQQGRPKDATRLMAKTYDLRARRYGKKHPHVLITHGNVQGDILRNAKELTDEIIKDALENIELKKQILGPGDASTITSIGELAYAYAMHGRLDASQHLFDVIEECGGPELVQNPHRRAQLLGKLAELHYRQRNLDKAVDYDSKALDIRQRVFGSGHQSVLLSKINLATTLHEKGMYEEAEVHVRDAVAGYEKIIDDAPHLVPRFLRARISLAAALYSQKRPEKMIETVKLFTETIEVAEAIGIPAETVKSWRSQLKQVLEEIQSMEAFG
ncbi:MAG: hypothetical protein M1821_003326 [Bathelium mastoideum]|nr:MAG: hypothetical protein M1821_003326 [Bathelium mastoideum]